MGSNPTPSATKPAPNEGFWPSLLRTIVNANDSILQFYERLAASYHLIFGNWREAVLRQGEILDKLIREQLGDKKPLTILDCSCGIGTQAIGLALRGYRVHATDLSPAQIERAKQQADTFGARLTFGIADMRALESQVEGRFDIAISCDNSLPHLLTRDDLSKALRNIHAKIHPVGLFIASIRDYDRIVEDHPRVDQPRILEGPEGKRIVFQVWDWSSDGISYTAHLFILREAGGEWHVAHYATPYRALLRQELDEILESSGFSKIRWHMPSESGY